MKNPTTFNILDYGAVADGTTLNTEAFRRAIEACAEAGGGTVEVPAGVYLTGAIHLRSRITLHLHAGAKLLFSTNPDHYPTVRTRWSGYECYGYSPLIYGIGLQQVAITGRGVIDGQGAAWWESYRECKAGRRQQTDREREFARLNASLMGIATNIVEWPTQFLRPPLLQLVDCENVLLEGVTLQNSPFWNTHLVYCRHVTAHGLTILNPSDTPNGDGMDIDSCSYVRVSDCHFDVGDDCLCLKSGIDEDGRRVGLPTENVAIVNCTMKRGHGGVVLGSETAGGIRHVVISNCIFIDTDRGIRLKSNRARGGTIEELKVSNVFMKGVLCPFAINSFYRHGVDPSNPSISSPEPQPVTECTPVFRNIYLSHITATEVKGAAAFLYGLPEMPIEGVVLDHVTIETTRDPEEAGGEPDMVREKLVMAGKGLFAKHVRELSLHHVRIETREGAAIKLDSTENVDIRGFAMRAPHEDSPVIELKQSTGVTIADSRIGTGAKQFVRLDGMDAVELRDNRIGGGCIEVVKAVGVQGLNG
ncbi:glycoside hydrolase family 28 protein [Paenibacillus thermoaerophilus]|uniref:Glycoside hydrolase family 28 protein n=1 Tax=Paenibacillus thermoaerophilus TaxID=1215385 RepID=A0ABW2V562_9BACL|nr:glycoside hydrolase family 28 protein [Paenibacillus thermoaerophilus]TMV17908.1 glycoside hydrolase family 28 protein [Paenibacillus thermoaerophilus]